MPGLLVGARPPADPRDEALPALAAWHAAKDKGVEPRFHILVSTVRGCNGWFVRLLPGAYAKNHLKPHEFLKEADDAQLSANQVCKCCCLCSALGFLGLLRSSPGARGLWKSWQPSCSDVAQRHCQPAVEIEDGMGAWLRSQSHKLQVANKGFALAVIQGCKVLKRLGTNCSFTPSRPPAES